ncbi:hypothetical protein [Vibrio gallicus]|uniref:hypothetical protein n=1 Tax=Vibrio gallicus TaxID=190897 RepID=UPI0029056C33|nr:hypothetical protein [Vibrio gallicus]
MYGTATFGAAQEDIEEKCLSKPSDDRALNKAYHYLNTKFCQPAVWFDNFFVDERITENARAGTSVRWKNDFTYYELTGFKYNARLNAKFNLPKVNRRLKLVIESDGEDDLFDLFPRSAEELESSVGVRYDWIRKGYSSFNFKATFRPSIEARYQFTYPLTINNTLRITQKLYQKKKITGESTQIDLDFAFTKKLLLRWSSFAEHDWDYDTKDGIWGMGSGFTLYQYLSNTQALNYTLSTLGTDEPKPFIYNTQIGMTYRHNIFYRWLYYEITPEYNWYREYKQSFIEEASIRLRLEILFENF